MKPNLTKKWCIGFAYAFVLFSNLGNVQYAPMGISPTVERYLSSLSSTEQPVKTVVGNQGHYVYWLSFIGEIHRIPLVGGLSERIVQSVGTDREAMFVEDFCLDQNDRLFFTDLLDQETGLSAIKMVDSSGYITTVTTLQGESPYQIRVCPRTGQIYYLTKETQVPRKIYRVRTVGEEAALASSFTKIDQLDAWVENGLDSSVPPAISAEKSLAASW